MRSVAARVNHVVLPEQLQAVIGQVWLGDKMRILTWDNAWGFVFEQAEEEAW